MTDMTRRQFLTITSARSQDRASRCWASRRAKRLPRSASSSSLAPLRRATPVPTAPWPAAFSCTRWATSRRTPRASIFHIEGDPDHPVNRGTLCPKGAALIDFIHSPSRLKYPEYRAPGSDHWQRISWDDALDRIARLMKQDRDANFVAEDAGRPDREPLAHDRHAGGVGEQQRSRLSSRTRWFAASASWRSTIRRVCDTARRWQVLPRRLAVER